MSEEYYLRNKERGYIGNSFVWYAIDGRGYTDNIDNAHLFDKHEVERFLKEDPQKWEAYPRLFIDEKSNRVFDSQKLSEFSEWKRYHGIELKP